MCIFFQSIFLISLLLNSSSAFVSRNIVSKAIENIKEAVTRVVDVVGASLVENTLNTLITFNPIHRYDHSNLKQNATFDFIIVGAGAAGCVLANRLSEISKWKILLLENGGESPDFVDIPLLSAALVDNNLDYGFSAEYDAGYCRECENKKMHIPRGKALGGSTEINIMIHTRGNKANYDEWAAMGNDGWAFKDVLPYFIKLENTTEVSTKDDGYHGNDGYLSISDVVYQTGIGRAIINASLEGGYEYVDYNGKKQLGVSLAQGTLRNGKRCSVEKAYLRPVRHRRNLRIIPNAQVTSIIFNENHNKATGVFYTREGKKYAAYATKEVIVSAGAINSPQLLMVSGIGPKDHLKEFNITVVKDLPVGKTMYDHLILPALPFKINASQSLKVTDFLKPSTYTSFFLKGKGPLTSISGGEVLCYFNSNTTNTPAEYPDIEIIFAGLTIALDFGIMGRKSYSVSHKSFEKYYSKFDFVDGFEAIPMSAHPYSVGYLKLRSSDMRDKPLIYPKYLSDDRDVKTFIAAIREIQRLVKQPSLQQYDAKLLDIPHPGCESHILNSDEYWACVVRGYAVTTHHHIATCKMGPKSDPTSVVDNNLLVHGVKNLRVVDASIIPSTVVAHTTAPTVMIAEKASDIIKKAWNEI